MDLQEENKRQKPCQQWSALNVAGREFLVCFETDANAGVSLAYIVEVYALAGNGYGALSTTRHAFLHTPSPTVLPSHYTVLGPAPKLMLCSICAPPKLILCAI
jgi:hypothetical protein